MGFHGDHDGIIASCPIKSLTCHKQFPFTWKSPGMQTTRLQCYTEVCRIVMSAVPRLIAGGYDITTLTEEFRKEAHNLEYLPTLTRKSRNNA